MEGRVPGGPCARPESTERSRLPSAGTRAYPYPQVLTPVRFSPITTGAYKHYCGAFQRHRDRQLPQPQLDKQQHHQHRREPQQQFILPEGRQEYQPQYVRPTPSLLPQPVKHGTNQALFGQAPYFNGFRLPPHDPRWRTWSRLVLGDSGSAASIAAPPGVAPPKKHPLQGVPPGGPGQALARGSSSPHEQPSTSLWPWSQVTPSHPVTGAEVQKQSAVPLKEDRSRTLQGEKRSSRYGPPNQDLVKRITKTEKDIPQVESSSDKLKEKRNELQASSSAGGGNGREDAMRLKLPSFAKRIYSENREKARRSHAVLDHIGRKLDQALYREPSDTAVYRENKEKFKKFKKHLTAHIQKSSKEDKERDESKSRKYDRLMETSKK
ncbi:hypothetical protein HPB50_015308 [Hyalomma asiaticum]|uniref:Uncharacterized protein n=1 Tax=Hyalomma asiaticum TaxID=266040 RepID=A0ACB7TKW3_HYAAI|nr:hypothetical protein HPB50_015308 [Hyalomma asiaticum]